MSCKCGELARLHGMAWQPKALRIRHVPRLTVRGGVAATLKSFAMLAGIAGFVWAVANAPHHPSTPPASIYQPPRITIPTYRPPQIDWSYQVRIPKIELPPMRTFEPPRIEVPRFETSRITIPLERPLPETRTYTPPVAPANVVERHAPTDVPN